MPTNTPSEPRFPRRCGSNPTGDRSEEAVRTPYRGWPPQSGGHLEHGDPNAARAAESTWQ